MSVALSETNRKYNTSKSQQGGKKTAKRRQRCVTFQRSEVRAPLFPIQPMLWILFQKVLSLANGPWSHTHRDKVQGGQRGPDSQEREEGMWRKRRKKRKRGELGSEWWNTNTTSLHPHDSQKRCVCVTTAPQLNNRMARWERRTRAQHHHGNKWGHVCWTTQHPIM